MYWNIEYIAQKYLELLGRTLTLDVLKSYDEELPEDNSGFEEP